MVEPRGVYQSRIPVRGNVGYKGYLWLKTDKFEGSVTIAFEADMTGGEINKISGDWKKYEFTLNPAKGDPLARLAILINGRGRLWIDQVSLMPADAVDGVRADVFEKAKALKPAFVRWPGGNVAQDYRWMWGVGPRDERTAWVNLSWKNEQEPGDFGTDEFIKFCSNKAVNTDQKSSRSARVDVAGIAVASGAQMEIITAGSIWSANSFSTPDVVSIRSSQISAGNSFTIELPAHSVSVISLNVGK